MCNQASTCVLFQLTLSLSLPLCVCVWVWLLHGVFMGMGLPHLHWAHPSVHLPTLWLLPTPASHSAEMWRAGCRAKPADGGGGPRWASLQWFIGNAAIYSWRASKPSAQTPDSRPPRCGNLTDWSATRPQNWLPKKTGKSVLTFSLTFSKLLNATIWLNLRMLWLSDSFCVDRPPHHAAHILDR